MVGIQWDGGRCTMGWWWDRRSMVVVNEELDGGGVGEVAVVAG